MKIKTHLLGSVSSRFFLQPQLVNFMYKENTLRILQGKGFYYRDSLLFPLRERREGLCSYLWCIKQVVISVMASGSQVKYE